MNKKTNTCPCCGNPLLRHARHSEIYWFCTSCWQEVPVLTICELPRLETLAATATTATAAKTVKS